MERQILQIIKKNKKLQIALLVAAVIAVLCVVFIPSLREMIFSGGTPGTYGENSYAQDSYGDSYGDAYSTQSQQGGESEQSQVTDQAQVSQQPQESEPIQESSELQESVQESESQEAAVVSDLKFRSKKLLTDHYEKHGMEMGFASAKEYEAAAAAVVVNPKALHKTEAEDGDDVYYVEETNEFVIVSTDGYIRTYFNPSGGLSYYNRQ